MIFIGLNRRPPGFPGGLFVCILTDIYMEGVSIMLTLKEYKQSKDVKGLVQKMFEARQVVHNLHLKTKSFAQHEALGGFYEGIVGMVDDFVETYQGQHGLLEDCQLQVNSVDDPVNYLEDCAKLFSVGRDSLKEPHLQNMMDEIVALTYKTLYKLKFLK